MISLLWDPVRRMVAISLGKSHSIQEENSPGCDHVMWYGWNQKWELLIHTSESLTDVSTSDSSAQSSSATLLPVPYSYFSNLLSRSSGPHTGNLIDVLSAVVKVKKIHLEIFLQEIWRLINFGMLYYYVVMQLNCWNRRCQKSIEQMLFSMNHFMKLQRYL